MAGNGTKAALIIIGVIFIIIFLATLSMPEIPVIWYGAVFVGLYLIFRGITMQTTPKAKDTNYKTVSSYPIDGPLSQDRWNPSPDREEFQAKTNSSYGTTRFCPGCGGHVEPGWVICPSCGGDLELSCRTCGAKVEKGWKLCPYCESAV